MMYSVDEIPQFKIDYKGMIKYAKSVNKAVTDLTDSEKEQFTNGVKIEEIKAQMLSA